MRQTIVENELKATTKSISPETSNQPTWIDITVPIFQGLVHWPGDPSVSIERINDMDKGAANNVAKISFGSHTGTHIDAPRHFIKDGPKIDTMQPDKMIGAARVIEIQDSKYITPNELLKYNIRRGERILFKTRNSSHPWYRDPFDEDFVSISAEAADFLADKAPKVVGIDYLSVGGFKSDGSYIHRKLLGSGIWLIEGLDLSKVKPGKYYLNCQPLKLEPGDGAPARALLKPM